MVTWPHCLGPISKAENCIKNSWWRKAVCIMVTRGKKKSCFYNVFPPILYQAQAKKRINLFMRPDPSQCSILPKAHISLNTVALRIKPSICGTWGLFKIQVIVSGLLRSDQKGRRTLHLWQSTWTWTEGKVSLLIFWSPLLLLFLAFVVVLLKTLFKHISHWIDIKPREKWERI